MTLDNFECQNRGFYRFFSDFELRDTFQKRIAPKSVKIDKDKLHMKFSALNIHFMFKQTCAWEHQDQYPCKSCYLPLLASLLWKRLQITNGMLLITTSTSDEFFSRINIDDFERPLTFKMIDWFIDFCDLRLQRTLQWWTVMKWLEIDWQFANRNCYRLSCVSWALAKIFCYIWHKNTKLMWNSMNYPVLCLFNVQPAYFFIVIQHYTGNQSAGPILIGVDEIMNTLWSCQLVNVLKIPHIGWQKTGRER